jgi:hypothetical protein
VRFKRFEKSHTFDKRAGSFSTLTPSLLESIRGRESVGSSRDKLISLLHLTGGKSCRPIGGRIARRQFMKLAGLVAGGAAFSEFLPMNQEVNAMLSEIPIIPEKIEAKDLDKEILRAAIIAEYDAINLYEQMAAATQDDNVKKILLDIAREEKTHVGEFQALLLMKDREHKKELEEGKEEVRELLGK